jgi:hypothetical protein
MVGAQLHRRVDGVDRADPFVQGVDRLVDHRHQHAVDDEGGEVLGVAGDLAQRLGEGHGRLVGRHVGGDAADDLHQLHQRHRVHEVQADEALGTIRGRGQAGDRDRRGVRGQQRVGLEVRLQAAEDRLLDLLVLGGRLDGQVGRADGLQALGRRDAGQGRLHGGVVDDAAADLAGQVLLDEGQTRVDPLARDVMETHVVAGEGDDMRDAGPHLARADDADRLDFTHKSQAFA